MPTFTTQSLAEMQRPLFAVKYPGQPEKWPTEAELYAQRVEFVRKTQAEAGWVNPRCPPATTVYLAPATFEKYMPGRMWNHMESL